MVMNESNTTATSSTEIASQPGNINRRQFIGATVAATGAMLAGPAYSYARILGANDRISLGHIGVGHRGDDLTWIAGHLKPTQNFEMTAVCDLWKVNREKAVQANEKYYGRAPRAFEYLEDLLA